MALKAKSSDADESSNDENSKMKSYIIRQFKKFMKMPMGRVSTRTVGNPILLSSKAKARGRRMLVMAVSTLFS